jgi:hypothetical protein
MAYIKERMDGAVTAYPHKMRVMLEKKISEMLSRYSLDEVLSEIAAQRPTFDLHLRVAQENRGTSASEKRSA